MGVSSHALSIDGSELFRVETDMRSLVLRSLCLPALAAIFCLSVASTFAQESPYGPLSEPQAEVPHGVVTKMPPWLSKIFPETTRDWWVYVPAQYKPEETAAVMVFQDGHDYVGAKGAWRVPVVFDNLIASGAMPVTVAIFIDPGHAVEKEQPKSAWQNSNRSFEYDSLGDRYARFLLEEILPEVEKTHPLSHDPAKRAICGASSGAICAFTVAWEHPEAFGKVLSTIGTFTNIRGGNAYPSLIRKTERKPIRVWLEDVSGDVDNQFGNWPLANQQMEAALKFQGYDVKLEFAEGFNHSSKHAGPIFPQAATWLWRKETPALAAAKQKSIGGDMPLESILVEGAGWEVVAEGLGFADGPMSDAEGNFYFSDMKAPGIFKITTDGTKTKISDQGPSGMKFGPDGRIYACEGAKKRIVAIDVAKPGAAVTVLAEEVQPNDLAVSKTGLVYFTETGKKQVSLIDLNLPPKDERWAVTTVDVGITAPNGIALSPDQGTLAVSDYGGENAWVFRVGARGGLSAKSPYMTLRRPIDPAGKFEHQQPPPLKKSSGGDGMCTDAVGRYFITSALGVQIFDPTGRMCGVLPKPQSDKPLTSCTLAGKDHAFLYVTNGDKIYRRPLQPVPAK